MRGLAGFAGSFAGTGELCGYVLAGFAGIGGLGRHWQVLRGGQSFLLSASVGAFAWSLREDIHQPLGSGVLRQLSIIYTVHLATQVRG